MNEQKMSAGEFNNLDNIKIEDGDFVVICGKTGAGKTKFLEALNGRSSDSYAVSYISSNPNDQIFFTSVSKQVTYILENTGSTMPKVAEIFCFLGIEKLFNREIKELSEGQKQLINIAFALISEPDMLILDAPFSYLDPIFKDRIIEIIKKVNRELLIPVVVAENSVDDLLDIADKLIVLDKLDVVCSLAPKECISYIRYNTPQLLDLMPEYIKLYVSLSDDNEYPMNTKEASLWFQRFIKTKRIDRATANTTESLFNGEYAVELKSVSFGYNKAVPVLNDLSVKFPQNSVSCIIGGNGAGKTTLLKTICGILKPLRGQVYIGGKGMRKCQKNNHHYADTMFLPSDPTYMFIKETLEEDIMLMIETHRKTDLDKQKILGDIVAEYGISDILSCPVRNLSFGQKQLASIAKIMIFNPKIIVMDEPSKGFDSYTKDMISGIFNKLKDHGVTIILASHDLDFAAKYTDFCYFMFNSQIIYSEKTEDFLTSNNFYTTKIHQIVKRDLPCVTTYKDVIKLCSKNTISE